MFFWGDKFKKEESHDKNTDLPVSEKTGFPTTSRILSSKTVLENGDRRIHESVSDCDIFNDIDYVVSRLNSSLKYRLLLRGGVLGTPSQLWDDLVNEEPPEQQQQQQQCVVDDPTYHKLSCIPMPADLRSQFPLLSTHLAVGYVGPPIDRVWVAVDNHVFLWDIKDDDVAFIDLESNDVAVAVDAIEILPSMASPSSSNHEVPSSSSSAAVVDMYLVIASCSKIFMYEVCLRPTLSIANYDVGSNGATPADDDSEAAHYVYKYVNSDIMISTLCTGNGRVFFGSRDGRVFELKFSGQSFWSSSCTAVEMTDFGPGFFHRLIFPMFFSRGVDSTAFPFRKMGDASDEDDVDENAAELRNVEQLLFCPPDLLVVRRSGQLQSARLSYKHGTLSDRNIYKLNFRCSTIQPIDTDENGTTFLLAVGKKGKRYILNDKLHVVFSDNRRCMGVQASNNAFADPETGLCLIQRSDDGALFYTDRSGGYRRLVDDTLVHSQRSNPDYPSSVSMIWAFGSLLVRGDRNAGTLSYSRFCRPARRYVLVMTNQVLVWTIPAVESPSAYLDNAFTMQLSLSEILQPYWSRPLAYKYAIDGTVNRDGPYPIVSAIDADSCRRIVTYLNCLVDGMKRVLDGRLSLRSAPYGSSATLLNTYSNIRDVFVGWQLVSVEHQLHAVASHVPQENLNRLITWPLKQLCRPCGQPVITALLNGLIQLYLDDCAATDALIARLKLLSPAYFSPETALLAQASRLLKKDFPPPGHRKPHMVATEDTKEAMNLLLRGAAAVDMKLWAPALCRLELYSELVNLTVMIANRHIDSRNCATAYYMNSLAPEDDPVGARLFERRMKLYRTVLNAAESTGQHAKTRLRMEILKCPEDDLFQWTLFDDLLLQFQREENMDRVDDYILDDLSSTPAFVRFLEKQVTQPFRKSLMMMGSLGNGFDDRSHDDGAVYADVEADHNQANTTCLYSLRLLCRVYEMNRHYLKASIAIKQFVCTPGSKMSIEERLNMLHRAQLLLKYHTTSRDNFGDTSAFASELESLIEVATVQARIADGLLGYPEEQEVRHGELMDFTTLYRSYAEPFHLYECQLAIMALALHSDLNPIYDLWRRICNGCSPDGHAIKVAFSMLPNKDDDRYIPLALIIESLELAAKQFGHLERPCGWSIEVLVRPGLVTIERFIDAADQYVDDLLAVQADCVNYVVNFLARLSDVVVEFITEGKSDVVAVNKMLTIMRRIDNGGWLHETNDVPKHNKQQLNDNGMGDGTSSSEVRRLQQDVKTTIRTLERTRQQKLIA